MVKRARSFSVSSGGVGAAGMVVRWGAGAARLEILGLLMIRHRCKLWEPDAGKTSQGRCRCRWEQRRRLDRQLKQGFDFALAMEQTMLVAPGRILVDRDMNLSKDIEISPAFPPTGCLGSVTCLR